MEHRTLEASEKTLDQLNRREIIEEYNLIKEKKSNRSRNQRDKIVKMFERK